MELTVDDLSEFRERSAFDIKVNLVKIRLRDVHDILWGLSVSINLYEPLQEQESWYPHIWRPGCRRSKTLFQRQKGENVASDLLL